MVSRVIPWSYCLGGLQAADTTYRKINTSPATIDDKEVLKKPLTAPLVKKIDLHFPLGLEVTARNLKGVTVKDALDAIYKQFKKRVRSDDLCQLNPSSLS